VRVDEGRGDQPVAGVDGLVGRAGVGRCADPGDLAVADEQRGRVTGCVHPAEVEGGAHRISLRPTGRRTASARRDRSGPGRGRTRRGRDVAVTDEHGHVGGQALGAERGGRERARPREEDHGAARGGWRGSRRARSAGRGEGGRRSSGTRPRRDVARSGAAGRPGVGRCGGPSERRVVPLRHDLQHRGPDRVPVAAVPDRQLPVRRGVEVEPLDPNPHLVRRDLRRRLQPLGGLRQHSGRGHQSVQPDRARDVPLPEIGVYSRRTYGPAAAWRDGFHLSCQ
jgi:hypothetical protein